MSAHVSLNFFDELGKSDKMRDLPSILSLFCTNALNERDIVKNVIIWRY